MAGTVYVFNGTPNAMLLILNNQILTTNLAGIQKTSNYAPQQTTAPRNPAAGNPGNAQFGGSNTLIVSFPSGTSQTYPVNIDPNQIQIDNDLQLYIFFNVVILVIPGGSASSQGQQQVIVSSTAGLTAEQQAIVDENIASLSA